MKRSALGSVIALAIAAHSAQALAQPPNNQAATSRPPRVAAECQATSSAVELVWRTEEAEEVRIQNAFAAALDIQPLVSTGRMRVDGGSYSVAALGEGGAARRFVECRRSSAGDGVSAARDQDARRTALSGLLAAACNVPVPEQAPALIVPAIVKGLQSLGHVTVVDPLSPEGTVLVHTLSYLPSDLLCEADECLTPVAERTLERIVALTVFYRTDRQASPGGPPPPTLQIAPTVLRRSRRGGGHWTTDPDPPTASLCAGVAAQIVRSARRP